MILEGIYRKLLEEGLTRDQIYELDRMKDVARGLLYPARDPLDGTPKSAYDALVLKVTDCDSDAQVVSAIFDSKGYTTAILAIPGHAYPIVKIGDKWVSTDSYSVVNFKEYFDAGVYVHTQPTNGQIRKK